MKALKYKYVKIGDISYNLEYRIADQIHFSQWWQEEKLIWGRNRRWPPRNSVTNDRDLAAANEGQLLSWPEPPAPWLQIHLHQCGSVSRDGGMRTGDDVGGLQSDWWALLLGLSSVRQQSTENRLGYVARNLKWKVI